MMTFPKSLSCHGKNKFLSVVNYPVQCECINILMYCGVWPPYLSLFMTCGLC